jgi:hypothetical protein
VYGRAAWNTAGLHPPTPWPGPKKNPGHQPGQEAFLLSHIKAPAQGGKAGSGKPPDSEFNKDETRFQANSPLSLTFQVKK